MNSALSTLHRLTFLSITALKLKDGEDIMAAAEALKTIVNMECTPPFAKLNPSKVVVNFDK